MYKVRTYNNIAKIGLDQFTDQYKVGPESDNPDAILSRSHKLQIEEINSNVKAVGRAGAGVNNVPVDYCSSNSIVVFNAPGANANAVKELVMAGLLLGSRGIISGINYVNGLSDMKDADAMNKLLEKEKKNFKGRELQGKTLGVIGLGAIGSQVANMALTMGMKVIGYDPAISIEAAWRLSSDVKKMDSLESLFSNSDYVSLHLPVLESTRKLINSDLLKSAKTGL